MKQLTQLFLFICLAVSLSGKAQQYIYLVKKGNTPYKRLGISDPIRIKTYEGGKWIEGRISNISTKSITLGRVSYPISEIEAMRTYSSLMKTGGYTLGVGGIFFTGIALFNRAINEDRPLLYPGQIITGGALVGTGYLLYLFSRKTYKVENGWQFKVIDLNEE